MTEPESDLAAADLATIAPVQPDPAILDRGEAARRAVLAIYDAHHRELASFVRAIERDADAADDVVAEAFARLTAEIRRGRTPDRPGAWLHRVAANLVIDGGRRRSVFGRVAGRLVERGAAEPADTRLLLAETRRELHDALGALPCDARTALMLAAHGFTGREVAEALGRSELATRSLLWRARTSLREQLAPREDGR